MLISFEVQNYRSIGERQELSFIASSLKDCESGIIKTDAFSDGRLLPALLIYGANAAGKTNLIRSMVGMFNTIIMSQTHGTPTGKIPTHRPFRLAKPNKNLPSIFELNFIMDSVRYNYGFSLLSDHVHEEWLYSFPMGTSRKLFERTGQIFSFGRNLKGKNVAISELTRRNSLFLSAAAQNGHDILSDIYEFFFDIQIELSLSMSASAAESRIKEDHQWVIDSEVIDFLSKINTGIVGYRTKEREVTEEEMKLSKKLNLAIKSVLEEEENSDLELEESEQSDKVIELEHRGADGESHHFPIHLESAGTLRLLSALPKVLGALKTGGIVIVDELDLSLHTQAAELLLNMFCSKETNPLGAQIIATTHDTNLLDSNCLRRDQVWFVSKNKAGSSEVYPLTDIRTRATDNIEKGYLQGRFGATSFESILQ